MTKDCFTHILKRENGKGNFQSQVKNLAEIRQALPSRLPDHSDPTIMVITGSDVSV